MKKIVVISVKKPSNAGGAEIVWQNLSNKGLKFSNISLDQKNLPFFYKNVTNLFHIKEIISSKWLLKEGLSLHPKILIYDKLFGWRKLNTSTRKICYNHGSYTMAGLKFKQKNLIVYIFYKYILGFCEKRSYKNSDKIIAVSESVKKDMIKYFRVSENKIKVINNGVDLNLFHPLKDKNILRKKYHLPEDKKIILFPGRPSYGKGFDIALEVIERLGSSYCLIVLGEGSVKNSNVHFLGKITNNKMPEIYNIADLSFFPSRYEGNSVSVLESAACGTPLILSNTGLMKSEPDMKEFTGSNLEDYVDKIKTVFTNNNLKKISQRWLDFVKKFSLKKQLKEMEYFIENEA